MIRHRLSLAKIKSGEKTKTIYTWIKEGNYKEAITVLNDELCLNQNSRAALSLLAYCHYILQEFEQSQQYYEKLIEIYPNEHHYWLNYTKCLYEYGSYEKALKTIAQYSEKFHIDDHDDDKKQSSSYDRFAHNELIKIQAAIKYTNDDDNINAKLLIDQLSDDNGDNVVDKETNLGCLLFKEKRYDDAIEKFRNALQMENINLSNSRSTNAHSSSGGGGGGGGVGQMIMMDRKSSEMNKNGTDTTITSVGGSSSSGSTTNSSMINQIPDLLYNLAVCYYHLRQYSDAMKFIGEIIEQGIREHPELSVGMNTEGLEVRSVGNTEVLHESILVEAFNLKAAIEYQLKNLDAAKEALTDMPPRSEEELDAVTLHNMALISMDTNPAEGFEKLQFLIGQETFQVETFANLLLLYCRYEYYELAADLMAENASFTYRYLSPYLYEFLDALITQQTSPEDAYQKFDEIATKHMDSLRKLSKQIQDAKNQIVKNDDANIVAKQNEIMKKLKHSFDEVIELYLPVLMAQAKIYWDIECYSQVEKVFRKSAEFCNELDLWKLNVAHVLFMQENKFKEATGFYEQLVKRNYDNILEVSAIVLANLCVSYIMTGQNEDAEELMRKIEKEEEQLIYGDPDKKIFHLCIVNLVIGTLYCSKGNYEFGISRVIKSLDPYPKKLGTDTWFYAKRCFLAMLENLAKQVIVIKDSVLQECIQFLSMCEQYGQNVKAIVEAPLELETLHPGKNTVTYEARLLKALLLDLIEN
ncbi:tetratricopeptide repeat domain 30 isoform X2 [Dermatophagoides farinae]|uniref:tetratricopeptide repeat domain 30 isoform X2 n=1 Tax=Dermatophagoides farinae TaxID=6954 RepID=UPI001F0F7CA6|nr:tetratricopeptide repeat protein 30A-like [Dermatophagoides farinae]